MEPPQLRLVGLFLPRVGRLEVAVGVGPGDFLVPQLHLFEVHVFFLRRVLDIIHYRPHRADLHAFELVVEIFGLGINIPPHQYACIDV